MFLSPSPNCSHQLNSNMAQIFFTLNDLELVIEKTLQKREVTFSEDIIALVNISQRRAKKQIEKTRVTRKEIRCL